jgi:hypothetical protein
LERLGAQNTYMDEKFLLMENDNKTNHKQLLELFDKNAKTQINIMEMLNNLARKDILNMLKSHNTEFSEKF